MTQEQKLSKIKITELDIEVEDVSDFNEAASEILTEYCNELETQGMTRPITDNGEYVEEGWTFIWTSQGSDLIRKEIDRLYKIGVKYFGETLELDISSYMFCEP